MNINLQICTYFNVDRPRIYCITAAPSVSRPNDSVRSFQRYHKNMLPPAHAHSRKCCRFGNIFIAFLQTATHATSHTRLRSHRHMRPRTQAQSETTNRPTKPVEQNATTYAYIYIYIHIYIYINYISHAVPRARATLFQLPFHHATPDVSNLRM